MNYKRVFATYRLEIFIFVGVLLGVVFTLLFIYVKFHPPESYDSNGLPLKGYVTYKFVSSRQEANLIYPNARIFSRFGGSERPNDGGFEPANAGAILTTTDQPEKIYQWYDSWLTTHGWQRDQKSILGLADTQISLEAYTKDGKGLASRETFYVAIDRKKSLERTLGKQLPSNVTIFEYRYIVK